MEFQFHLQKHHPTFMALAGGVLSKLLGEASLKLFSTIFKEFGLLVGVKEEEGALESKLQVIRSVIRRAEELQLKEDCVKVFIEKLKDAAYDVEDLVDEFMTEALRQKVETRDGMQLEENKLKKVRNFFSTSNPLVFRSKMAHKIQALKKRIDDIVKEKRDFNCAELLGVDIPTPPVSQSRETCSFVIEDDVSGRDDDKAIIVDKLINSGNESDVSVIAIVGLGGMGKTTLAKLVFNDQSVVTHFHSRKWIYVSDQEFDVKSLLRKILQSPSHNASGQPNRGPSQTSDESSMEDLQTQLRITLSEKKYLLVLDDVWNECRDKWLELESLLRCGAVGSKILVTTRSDKVASIMGAPQTPPLRALQENECLSLFKKLAFGDKQEPNENLVKIGEEIVRKCGGVPLAVKTVGSLMYSKESEIEWLRVRDSETWLQDEDTGILPALRLSYNHLTPSLKECFAYCALFPKGYRIEVDTLVQQWIALGFIQCSEKNDLLEAEGEGYFKTLWSMSFFQDVERNDDGDMAYFTMHDLVHDLARAVAGNGFEFSGIHNHTTLQKTRHLFMIGRPTVGLKYMEALKNFDKMRSLIFIEMNSEVNICFRFRRLRQLDIRFSSISYLPESIGKLKHLRYLDLSWTDIEELPETICNLFNLQTLILNRTGIKKLPKGMRRMISLRNVEFDRNSESMLNGIGEVASLRKLPKFIVGEKSGCGIEELKILNLLRGHLSIERLDNIKNAQCAREASLKEKKYLRSLSLSYGQEVGDTLEGNLENVIQCLEPHSRLKRLSISRYMGRKFPSWMEQINLVQLSLSNCQRCQHLPQLGRLHSLESLSLSDMGAIEYIVEFDSGFDKKSIFPSLKKLVICDLRNLKGWSIMPNLEGLSSQKAASNDGQVKQAEARLFLPCLLSLDISSCPKLTHFPSLVLPTLENFEMKEVGLHKIQLMSNYLSMKKFSIRYMPSLESWSSQVDDDDARQEIKTGRSNDAIFTVIIEKCPKMIDMPQLLPSLYKLHIIKSNEKLLSSITRYTSLSSLRIQEFPKIWRLLKVLGPNHNNIHELQISYFPKLMSLSVWLENLPALKILKIEHCSNLMLIWPDGLLSSLEDLCIRYLRKKKTIFSGRDGIVFHSLMKLRIEGCENLESLCEGLEQNLIPTLQELMIRDCPNLVLMFPNGLHQHWLSSLQFLHIENSCKKQTVFQFGDGIVFHSLRKLHIYGWENLESLCEGLQQNLIPTLQELMIRDCPNLVLMLPDGLHQHWLSSLQDLKIVKSCKKQTVFPGADGIVFHSLRKLHIYGWDNLESLCEGLQQNLIPTLQELMIRDCPNLVPFRNGSQQQCLNSLKELTISDSCKQLKSFPGRGEGITLTSLRELDIRGCENLELLFEGLKENHIINLEKLFITNCPKLGNLPEWLGNLTSLKNLMIINCPSMNSLPTKLQTLSSDTELMIRNCPLLERRIQRIDRDESAQAAWILPRRLMESLKKTPCINPSSSS